MRQTICQACVAVAVLGGVAAGVLPAASPAFSQAAGGQASAGKQVALTQGQLDNLIAAQKDIHAAAGTTDKPDESKLAAAAKAHGFDSLAQYADVSYSVGLVLEGMDPISKTYVGPAAVMKKQIQQLRADTSMPPKDKKEALDELNAALQQSDSDKPLPANIAIVGANYDKISAVMEGD